MIALQALMSITLLVVGVRLLNLRKSDVSIVESFWPLLTLTSAATYATAEPQTRLSGLLAWQRKRQRQGWRDACLFKSVSASLDNLARGSHYGC